MYFPTRRRRPVRVDAHEGSTREWRARHAAEARDAARWPGLDRDQFLAGLLDRAVVTGNLILAAEHVCRHGGPAPGADGCSPAELDRREQIGLARALRDVVLAGTWRPGPVRKVRIPKPNGGERILSLPTVADRVLQRAILQVVQPYVETLLPATTLGSRPGMSVAHALALAEHLARRDGLWAWLTIDVRKAFDNVPHGKLLAVVQRWFGATPIAGVIERIVTTGRTVGIAQGGPLSPLLLLLFLHDHLHAPWHAAHPDLPMIQWVDDSLVLAPCRTAAEHGLAEIRDLIARAGMDEKADPPPTVSELAAGESTTWLGLTIRKEGDCLKAGITDEAWDHLRARLARRGDATPEDVGRAWVASVGPALEQEVSDATARRVRDELIRVGAGHIRLEDVREWCRRAGEAYRILRNQQSQNTPGQSTPEENRDGAGAPPARIRAINVPPPASTPFNPVASERDGPPGSIVRPLRVDPHPPPQGTPPATQNRVTRPPQRPRHLAFASAQRPTSGSPPARRSGPQAPRPPPRE